LAIGGHPRECDDRPLQGNGEHHDERDELTIHVQKLNCRGVPKQIIGIGVS
jgi:hypothetical protein